MQTKDSFGGKTSSSPKQDVWCFNVWCEERCQRWWFRAELLPNKLHQLCFFPFYPAGMFAFSGEPASPRGGSDTWWLPSERQQVAAAAAAERSSLPKIRQRGPSGTACRHCRTLPRRWKLLSTASRGAFQFCWRNKQRFEATPRVDVSPCFKTTGAGYYYVTQCCFCLFRFVQPVFRLFIHARLFCFAGLVKKKKI